MKDADKYIVKQVVEGDVAAFATLVDKYQHMAFTLALSIVKRREEAEEVVQDAFFKAYRNLVSFEGRSAFSTWLYQIVYRTAVSAGRNKKQVFVDIDLMEKGKLAGVDAQADKSLEDQDKRVLLQNALARLEEDDAFVVILFYYKELSVDEIQKITGLSVSNIKVKLHRARKQLHRQLSVMLKDEFYELK
ncbi:MAG: sigma-70 family RNA polymerase sigma factor [Breznakibacter sp.]